MTMTMTRQAVTQILEDIKPPAVSAVAGIPMRNSTIREQVA
jgi:hypothetical protein